LYQSPVALTPYASEERIDDEGLKRIIDDAYEAAELDPANIDTGAVILTGEALRRENAAGIAKLLSEQGGDFVCATAGHHMEAMLAAYGSGAARVSSDDGKRVLNIDIGGGTTKLGLVENGKVTATAAIHVGGRLQVVDSHGKIVRLDPAGRWHAAEAGFDWHVGDTVTDAELDRVAEGMADSLVAAIAVRPLPPAAAHLYLTEPIAELGTIDGIMLSGGVGEYVYRRETRDFGDMGRRLGAAIRRRIESGALPWPLLPAHECIRATALGASEYSVQLSGNTCTITTPGKLLPRRNLQVVQPPYEFGEHVDADAVAAAIRQHLTAFDVVEGEGEVALAFRWRGAPAHERIFAFAKGICLGMPNTIAANKPLYIMLDGDIAQTLGAVLREELDVTSEILVIDGVLLQDFDYVDLGKIRLPSMTVPVTIKSLIFREDPRAEDDVPHLHEHHHHHDHDHGHSHDHGHTHSHTHSHTHKPSS
jgi:ethanolamine utilization protein EutA